MYLLSFVLLLIVVYIVKKQKPEKLTYVLGLLALILIVCANTYEHIEGFTNLGFAPTENYRMGPLSEVKLNENDSLFHQEYNTYDGRKLTNAKSNCGWRKPPCNVPLLSEVKFTTPIGEDVPLTNDDPAAYSFPTVDGNNKSPQHLFMLTYNQVSPKCCPSTFSTSRGCVCMTNAQIDYINQRGGNKKTDSYISF
jgi:hypothetical protein